LQAINNIWIPGMSAPSLNTQVSAQVRRHFIWRSLSIALGGITVALYIAYFVAGFWFYRLPFPGFMLTYTNTVNAGLSSSDAAWAGLDAGLARQDWIISINGTSLNPQPGMDFAGARQRYIDALAQHQPGDTVTFGFQRDTRITAATPLCGNVINGIAECSVDVTLQKLPENDFLIFFLLPQLTGLFALSIGMLVLVKRGQTKDGFMAVAINFLGVIFMAGLFDIGSSRLFTPVWVIATSMLGAALITFGMLFPLVTRTVSRYAWLQAVPLGAACVVAAVLLGSYISPVNAWDNSVTQNATIMPILGIVTLIALQYFAQRPRAVTQTSRDQNYAILIGTGVLLISALLWLMGRLLLTRVNINIGIPVEVVILLTIFPIAAIAYAVLQVRRIDTDRVLTESLTYFIMVMSLVVSIFLLTLGGSLLARDFFDVSNPLISTAILVIMVLGFAPLRTRLHDRINEIYFRARRNYLQKVEDFGQSLAKLTDYDDVAKAYRKTLTENLNPTNIFIFLARRETDDYQEFEKQTDVRFNPNSTAIRLLSASSEAINLQSGQPWNQMLWTERARLTILRAAVLAPLLGTDRLNGFVVLGPSRSGNPYNFEEMRFISNLASQFAIATERAQVIDSLERRVRELDVLSKVGQAVNFTIEFDDLLELISNQTAKLVDAHCFYIVLFDESINQLQFGFFLEEDERYNDRENRRWVLDDGLFSEVIRTGKAIRIVNYMLEMRVRNAPLRFESQDLRAWMGVPLVAGRRKMGVIAVGKVNTDEPYSEEQFNIFTNIGALAATSIEKAALFNETKVRERQLTVLNDITRQLVATETDVEKLLNLIMASAVEILGAEAGSLLLTTQDSSNELEFRVVIGGAGTDLIGRRMKSNEGIVGQVATTGEPYIANDAIHDPKHSQTPGATTFQAQSLLAVPLQAKDTVVGVLEVLNKKDRTPFTGDDAKLLTTFAGQAAVAIENARLLQMTDIQLAQRVRELETLERVDAQLNRTLELHAVAQITVQSAMEVLNANAGALGLVNDIDHVLEIVSIEGYTEDEYPKSASGLKWSLDKGIVGRVMSSRKPQPDLVSDLSIAREYDGQLKGSLSQITLPMLSGKNINAILILEKTEMPPFSLTDWAFAQRLAEHASIAIANAQFADALTSANASKSEFMGFAAHELKNPLTPIKTGTDMLRSGMMGELSEPLSNMINMIYNNSARMERIIRDLQDAAKLEAGQFKLEDLKPLSMHQIIVASVQPFDRTLEDMELTFLNDVPEDLEAVWGDEGRLIQVFTNLISNCIKYTDPEKTIQVVGEVIGSHVSKDAKRMGKMVKISVIDQGFGMKPEDLARLGKESYFRSTNEEAKKKEGTGLGMKLTFGIVRGHGGDVEVTSELGVGTTFAIYLPAAPQIEISASPELTAEPASD
jgi:signal transduction histidine kinase